MKPTIALLILLAATLTAVAQTKILDEATYRLRPGDRLTARVAEAPAAPPGGLGVNPLAMTRKNVAIEDYLVSRDAIAVGQLGDIYVPVVPGMNETIRVQAAGKTIVELQKSIRVLLEAEYYHRATVQIQLLNIAARQATAQFFGEVRGSITWDPTNTKTLADAILEIGHSEFANLKKVKITRTNITTGRTETIIVDIKAVLDGDKSKDLPLQSGDRIEVPQKTLNF